LKDNNRQQTLVGAAWSALERFSVQGIQFIIMVVMARILSPTDYGLVGELTIFIVLGQLIADGGLSQAIIRKLDRNQQDASTAFFFNIGIGALLYTIIFFSAPLIAYFYEEPRLTEIARVLGLSVLINSALVVHRALLTAEIDFKTQAKSTLLGALCSGVAGIWMAYSGYGVWSIVAVQITNHTITGLTLWSLSHWRPSLTFSMNSFKGMFRFGSKLIAGDILDSIYNNLYYMAIGKVFSAYALGCYTRAVQFGEFPSVNLTKIIRRAVFPTLCSMQDDEIRLRNACRQCIRYYAFIIFPLMGALAALSQPLIELILGYQWIYSSQLLHVLCFAMMLYPINSVNLMILEVKGHGGTYLKLQVWSKTIGVASLCALIPAGLTAVCCGLCVTAGISLLLNMRLGGRSIGLGIIKQCRALLPTILMTATMYGTVTLCIRMFPDIFTQLIVGCVIGLVTYIGLALIFQSRDLKELGTLILQTIHK